MVLSQQISPRLLRSPADFELASADWMRLWGFRDVALTAPSHDGGIDIESVEAVGQVKAWMIPVGRPDIQRLKGVAHDGRMPLFFSLMAYTAEAVNFADTAGVGLFRFVGYNGEIEPVNACAFRFLAARQRVTDLRTDPVGSSLDAHPAFKVILATLEQVAAKGGGVGIFESRRIFGRYVQFALDNALAIQSVANVCLRGVSLLLPRDIAHLETLGWQASLSENFEIVYPTAPFPFAEAAGVLAKTLIEVHGVMTVEDLKVTGDL